MPTMSNVRTPMRLFAIPRRTPRFGSLCLAKKSLSASASASASRSSPPTTMPGSSGCRATCSSSAEPLLATRAAASWDAPIFRPTSRFEPLPPPRGAFALRSFGCFGSLVFGVLSAFGVCSRFLPPKEISFFQNGTFSVSAGSGGSCAAGTGGWTTVGASGTGCGGSDGLALQDSVATGFAATGTSATGSSATTRSSGTGSSATGASASDSSSVLGLRLNDTSFFHVVSSGPVSVPGTWTSLEGSASASAPTSSIVGGASAATGSASSSSSVLRLNETSFFHVGSSGPVSVSGTWTSLEGAASASASTSSIAGGASAATGSGCTSSSVLRLKLTSLVHTVSSGPGSVPGTGTWLGGSAMTSAAATSGSGGAASCFALRPKLISLFQIDSFGAASSFCSAASTASTFAFFLREISFF